MIKIAQLINRPYLQIAFDEPNIDKVVNIIETLPNDDRIIIEAGTPLIKRYGTDAIQEIRDVKPDSFIVADLKTLDTGALETEIAFNGGADAIVVSGLAPVPTIDNVISTAREMDIYSIIDTLNVPDSRQILWNIENPPDVIELHRGIDIEDTSHSWRDITGIKEQFNDILTAVAGGVQVNNVKTAMNSGADIIVVGRAITAIAEPGNMAKIFLDELCKR